ncbi:MAG: LLM class flavin-dependent oxidoreductase [Methylophilus sp.]|nr:LLM class flavin-dependent oxidoreductase [Methylophilus sp.]
MPAETPAEISALIADVKQRAKQNGRGDICFGLSIDVITRATEEEALAEARRFFDDGVRT